MHRNVAFSIKSDLLKVSNIYFKTYKLKSIIHNFENLYFYNTSLHKFHEWVERQNFAKCKIILSISKIFWMHLLYIKLSTFCKRHNKSAEKIFKMHRFLLIWHHDLSHIGIWSLLFKFIHFYQLLWISTLIDMPLYFEVVELL